MSVSGFGSYLLARRNSPLICSANLLSQINQLYRAGRYAEAIYKWVIAQLWSDNMLIPQRFKIRSGNLDFP